MNDFVRAPDGRRVAYSVTGRGAPIVLTNGLTTTTNFWRYLAPRWAEQHTVVMWDLPGHGDSEPPASVHGARIDAQPALITRVMDAVGLERAVQIGWSVGSQIVFELARQAPERCSALVSLLGPAGHVLSNSELPFGGAVVHRLITQSPKRWLAQALRFSGAHATLSGTLGRAFGLIGSGTSDADLKVLIETLCKVDVDTLRAMADSAEQHSADDVLPTLRVPLLIVAGDKDAFAPARSVARAMHAAAPDSTLVTLPEGTHSALLDHVEEIHAACAHFLSEHGLALDGRAARRETSR